MLFFRPPKTIFEKRDGDTLVQVVQRGEKKELRFGNHIVQSAVSESEPDFLLLEYTRAMMVGILFPSNISRILQIGLGAGAMPRFIHRYFPESHQTVAELSPEVIKIAYHYFHLPVSPRLVVNTSEGMEFLKENQEKFNLVFLDAYHADGVSPHLKSLQFFQSIRDHLEEGGWFVNNVWGSDKKNLEAVSNNLNEVFPHIYSLSVGLNTNVIYFAGNSPLTPTIVESSNTRAMNLTKKVPIDFQGLFKKIKKFSNKQSGPIKRQSIL